MARQAISGNFGVEFPLTVVAPKTRGSRRVWYKPNHRSFGAFMKSEQIRKPVAQVAGDIADRAATLSPVSQRGGDQDGKRMRDQFEVIREAGYVKVSGNIRVNVEVINAARSAAPNEFGTRKNRRHRMLGRAGAAFGDFKPEGGPS